MDLSQRWRSSLAVLALILSACAADAVASEGSVGLTRPAVTTTTTAQPAPRGPVVAPIRSMVPIYESVTPPVEPVPPRAGELLPRLVSAQPSTPFATTGGIVIFHPSPSVELIGFHESNHDGAQQLELLDTAARSVTLQTRNRGTGSRTAADVVVEPGVPIVAPATGTVIRAGNYTLYCDYTDHYAVIEPDAAPGWEVKVLHFLDLQVRAGDRVEGGVTVIGSGPRPLAFRSQVDDATAAPSWPHIHIEVVDPSIPDRPSSRGC